MKFKMIGWLRNETEWLPAISTFPVFDSFLYLGDKNGYAKELEGQVKTTKASEADDRSRSQIEGVA